MRLMAQTGEIDEFKDYITQTQKMRAYRGKIEATSPLAAMATPEPAPEKKPAPAPAPVPEKKAPPPEKKAAPRPVAVAQPAANGPAVSSNTSNLIMISAIVVLVLAAIGLLVALVIR
jgi:outer membrane biosynthesis protein TonB